MRNYDICIIGGGASGLAAAATLSSHFDTVLLEKNRILGRKIMATGGGRCNITNTACAHCDLTLEFFKSLGMELYHDSEGRYYPYSNQARDVVRVLEDAAEKKGVEVILESGVTKIQKKSEGFRIVAGKSSFSAKTVILACGGKAAPALGTTGDGYGLARSLGHETTTIYPILTGIECGDLKDLKGVRARGTVRLFREEKLLAEETGEIQFTEDGISGICVMNLTMYITAEKGMPVRKSLQRYHLELDLAPDFSQAEMQQRATSFGILSYALSRRVSLEKIKGWKLPVCGVKGWKNAQCTAGGIRLDEVDLATMESRLVPGLYLTGELLDIQGKCGGFNLQNAWETGIRAAEHLNAIAKIEVK